MVELILIFAGLLTLDCTIAGVAGQSIITPGCHFQADQEQEGTPRFASASAPFTRIKLPVSVRPLPGAGKKTKRNFQLQVTNQSDKPVARLVVRVYRVFENGRIDEFSHTSDRWFGETSGQQLDSGAESVITLENSSLPDGVVAVAGLARSVTWLDGAQWPVWTGPAPERQGNLPVTLRLQGIAEEGKYSAPLVEFYNHSRQGIEQLEYRIEFLDEGGSLLHRGTRTRLRNLAAQSGLAHVGQQGVPQNTHEVKLFLNFVKFDDGSRWEPED